MLKKSYWLQFAGLAFLAATLLVLPLGAKAEMYAEGYIGGVFPLYFPRNIGPI